jgi:hypothetical protein
MRKFKEAKESLFDFMEEHEEVFEKARELAAEFNNRLKNVKQRLRECLEEKGEKSLRAGEFMVSSQKPKKDYDIKMLQKEVKMSVLQDRGAVEVEVNYNVDEDRLLSLVNDGLLSQKVMEEACTETKRTPKVNSPYRDFQF